jgi:hypothetical protein
MLIDATIITASTTALATTKDISNLKGWYRAIYKSGCLQANYAAPEIIPESATLRNSNKNIVASSIPAI